MYFAYLNLSNFLVYTSHILLSNRNFMKGAVHFGLFLRTWRNFRQLLANIYLFKVDNRNTRKGFKICWKLTKKKNNTRRTSLMSNLFFSQNISQRKIRKVFYVKLFLTKDHLSHVCKCWKIAKHTLTLFTMGFLGFA